jgi:hypothetical protein
MVRWICALVLVFCLATGPARSETFPSRPITMIVVFAAGGPTDVLARIVAEQMSNTLGQRIIIENVAGAGGTTGGTRGARAAPDGYTLTVGSLGSHAAAPALYKDIQYDPRELEPIGLIAGLLCHPQGFRGHDVPGAPGLREGEPRQGDQRPCRGRLDCRSSQSRKLFDGQVNHFANAAAGRSRRACVDHGPWSCQVSSSAPRAARVRHVTSQASGDCWLS